MEAQDDPLCKMHDLGADPLLYAQEKLRANAESKERLLNMTVLPGQSYTKYGYAFLGTLYDTFSIGEQLTSYFGGINRTHLHRGFDGKNPLAGASQAIRSEDQNRALDMILDILSTKTTQKWLPSDIHLLLYRTGDIGTASIDVQSEISGLKGRLLSKLLSPEIALRIHAVGGIIEVPTNSSGIMSFDDYLDKVVDGVWHEKESWDLKLGLMKGLKKMHLQRCNQPIPAEVSMAVLAKLNYMFDQAGLLQKHSDQREANFMALVRLELDDYKKPCRMDGEPSD